MRVEGGCTLCGADVLGSKELWFYCKGCNLLFSSKYVNFSSSKRVAREQINKHFSTISKEEKIVMNKSVVVPTAPRLLQTAARKLARHAKFVEKLQNKLDKALLVLSTVEKKRVSPIKSRVKAKKRSENKKVSKGSLRKKSIKKKTTKKPSKKSAKKAMKKKIAKKVVKKKVVKKSKKTIVKTKATKKASKYQKKITKLNSAKKAASKPSERVQQSKATNLLRGFVVSENKDIEKLLQ